MTPKQKVLKKYDTAYSASFADCWVVFRDYGIQLGSGKSAVMAWKDAANATIYKELEAELAVKRESAQFWRYMAVLDRLAKAEAELKALTAHATREETGELPFIIRYGEQAMGTMYGWPLCTFDAPEPAIKYARDCVKGSPWFYYSVFEKETGKRLFDSRIEPAIRNEEGK